MKKAIIGIPVFIFLVLISGCTADSKKQETQIRVLNTMPADININFTSKKSKNNTENFRITRSENTGYRSLSSGKYEIAVNAKKEELLKKTFGLAGGEKYTAIIYGKPSFSSRKNEETFSHKMHFIFEGSENYTRNGFLPGDMVFRDKIKLKKGTTAVRVFHAAAGLTAINVKLREGKKSKKIASKLAYAHPVLSNQIKAGKKTIEVYLGNAPKPFIAQQFDFQSEKTYIIVLLNKNGKPSIQILEN